MSRTLRTVDYGNATQAIAEAGLVQRGGFKVVEPDAVPNVSPEQPARTLILIGNAGPGMWQRFSTARADRHITLDAWSMAVIGKLADDLGARALFPFTQPYLPFQAWARKAEACFVSPISMSIHPVYGLWHAYRGALAFHEEMDLPQREDAISPCESCIDQPCLSACPVSAFSEANYDTTACAAHLTSLDGADCMSDGCRARRACPVGLDYVYEPAQARFHMEAFLRARGSL